MSVQAMSIVFRFRLPPSEKFVLVCLGDAADDKGEVCLSNPELRKMTGYSRRAIQQILQRLIKKDIIIEATPATHKTPPVYRFLVK